MKSRENNENINKQPMKASRNTKPNQWRQLWRAGNEKREAGEENISAWRNAWRRNDENLASAGQSAAKIEEGGTAGPRGCYQKLKRNYRRQSKKHQTGWWNWRDGQKLLQKWPESVKKTEAVKKNLVLTEKKWPVNHRENREMKKAAVAIEIDVTIWRQKEKAISTDMTKAVSVCNAAKTGYHQKIKPAVW